MNEKLINCLSSRCSVLLFITLTVILFLLCFFNWAVWILIGFVVVASIFLNITYIIGLILFMVNFLVCFVYDGNNLWNYIYLYLIFILGIKYIISLIKTEEKRSIKESVLNIFKKVNWKILIPILILFIFWFLPIHSNGFNPVVGNILDFILLYLAFEMRNKINFPYIVQIFCLGLVLSGLMSLLRPVSERLQDVMAYVTTNGYVRFSGLMTHPNQFAIISIIAISLLFILKYSNKISYINFYTLFISIFILGYCSISRDFIISFYIALVIFFIACVIKYKKRFLKAAVALVFIIIAISGIFFTETKINLVRLNVLPESSISKYQESSDVGETKIVFESDVNEADYVKFSDEWWQFVYQGKIRYDPGREEIWSEYFNDWESSAATILFGRGLSQPYIGAMMPHNFYLFILWRDGIIGLLIQFFILFSFIDFNKLKEIKKYWVVFVLLIPYLFTCFFECGFMFFYLFFMLCCGFLFDNKYEKDRILIITSGVLPVPATKGGAVENLTQIILEQNEKYQKEKFEVISIYDDKAKLLSKSYKFANFIFYKPNKLITSLDKCIYFFVKNILKKEKTMTFRNLLQRFCYIHFVSSMMRDVNYKSIVVENFSSSFISLKLYDNYIKYEGRYFYHLHNEVGNTFSCKEIIQKTQNILCVSEFIKISIAKTLNLPIESKNLSVLKNCIDLVKFNGHITIKEKDELYLKYNIPKNKKIIIFAGRLTREKGIDILLRAVAKIKNNDFVLLVVGSYFFDTKITNEFEKELSKLKTKLGEKVIFTGFVDYSALPKLYALADFAVLPSVWEEPAGLTVLEAVASELPLITTDSGGITEYCNSKNAIILPRNKNLQRNLTLSIRKMLNNFNKIDNKEFVKSFSLSNYYKQFIGFLNNTDKKY